jgi:hypothetical protein
MRIFTQHSGPIIQDFDFQFVGETDPDGRRSVEGHQTPLRHEAWFLPQSPSGQKETEER